MVIWVLVKVEEEEEEEALEADGQEWSRSLGMHREVDYFGKIQLGIVSPHGDHARVLHQCTLPLAIRGEAVNGRSARYKIVSLIK